MKYIKRLIILGIIIVLLTPMLGFSREKNELKLMMDILKDTKASFVEGDISICGVILDRFLSENEMLQISESLIKELEIEGTLLLTKKIENEPLKKGYYLQEFFEEEGLNQLIVQGFDKRDNLITINLSSYQNKEDQLEETSLYINLINDEQFVENNDIILKAERIFDKFDKPINVTSCIVGSIDGNIDIDKKEEEILKATNRVKGKVVERYKDDDVISLSIFTPLIEEYIYTGNKKMNLNIAVRYNEYENETNILIGTPIITIGY